jgi:hypothetical protein
MKKPKEMSNLLNLIISFLKWLLYSKILEILQIKMIVIKKPLQQGLILKIFSDNLLKKYN